MQKQSEAGLAIALIVCFFLPYFSSGSIHFSGFQMVFGKQGIEGIHGAEKYLWLIVPIASLLILINAVDLPLGKFTYWLPLLGLAFIVIRIYMVAQAQTSNIGQSVGIGDVFQKAAYGFWISLVLAFVLAVGSLDITKSKA